MIKNPNTASIAERGYEVQPAANGGFVLFLGSSRQNPMGGFGPDLCAFSNADDLVAYITEQHGVDRNAGRSAA